MNCILLLLYIVTDCVVILRQFAGDGMEIGSLLVPMVLTSQMAFIKRWGDKNLRVTGMTLGLYFGYEELCYVLKGNGVLGREILSDRRGTIPKQVFPFFTGFSSE